MTAEEAEAKATETGETSEEDSKEEETVEEKADESAEEPQEAKPRKKKREKKVFSYYRIDERALTRLRPFCERCGPGYFMADHGNRHTCGHCSFTRYKQNQEKQ